jgi:microcystin-dependent protein
MDQSYIGSIVLAAFNFAPESWQLCNGQLLPISQYNAVYALLGTTYGGDGQTNFALPKLNGGALQPGLNYIICLNGIFPQRA